MRRLLSLVLLGVFSLPLILPALALGQDPEASLPACCRRNGAHHCMMSMQQKDALSQGTQASAPRPRCPSYPALIPPSRQSNLAAAASPSASPEIISRPVHNVQTQALARAASDRSHPKRGPPSCSIL